MIPRPLLQFIAREKWIRFGVRDRLLSTCHNPDTCSSEHFEIDFFGRRYAGNFSTFIDWSAYYYGAYASEELDLMRDALEGVEKPVVLDIGANIGHHTLFAATIAELVHSFEPFPLVYAKIHEKIRLNGLTNVNVHEIGLGETDEDLDYHPPENCNTGTGSFMDSCSATGNTLKLPIRRGDDYLAPLGLSKADFPK